MSHAPTCIQNLLRFFPNLTSNLENILLHMMLYILLVLDMQSEVQTRDFLNILQTCLALSPILRICIYGSLSITYFFFFLTNQFLTISQGLVPVELHWKDHSPVSTITILYLLKQTKQHCVTDTSQHIHLENINRNTIILDSIGIS